MAGIKLHCAAALPSFLVVLLLSLCSASDHPIPLKEKNGVPLSEVCEMLIEPAGGTPQDGRGGDAIAITFNYIGTSPLARLMNEHSISDKKCIGAQWKPKRSQNVNHRRQLSKKR